MPSPNEKAPMPPSDLIDRAFGLSDTHVGQPIREPSDSEEKPKPREASFDDEIGELLHRLEKARRALSAELSAREVGSQVYSGEEYERPSDVLAPLLEEARAGRALKAERERLEVQLAGCGAAALGAIRPRAEEAKEGDYGWSPAYGSVVAVRHIFENIVTASRALLWALRDPKRPAAPSAVALEDVLDRFVGKPGPDAEEGTAQFTLERPVPVRDRDRRDPEPFPALICKKCRLGPAAAEAPWDGTCSDGGDCDPIPNPALGPTALAEPAVAKWPVLTVTTPHPSAAGPGLADLVAARIAALPDLVVSIPFQVRQRKLGVTAKAAESKVYLVIDYTLAEVTEQCFFDAAQVPLANDEVFRSFLVEVAQQRVLSAIVVAATAS
jgi:hypothetical protein